MENSPNVLFLSTYNPEERSHGGQIRADEIAKFYERLGCKIFRSGVLTPCLNNGPNAKNFISAPNPEEYSKALNGKNFWHLLTDALLPTVIQANKKYYLDTFFDLYKEEPSIIHVEQPFLFKLALEIKEKYGNRPKIIYSCHNIEHPLVKDLVFNETNDLETSSEAREIVENLEIEAILNCDYFVACTKPDYDFIRSKNQSVEGVLCPNSANHPVLDKKSSDEIIRLTNGKTFALFIGSGHPPNRDGFFHFLGGHSAAFASDSLLLVAGTVSPLIQDRIDEMLFKEKIKILGLVERKYLDTLILLCKQIILPINCGGGSNLKTAEALLSGKKIVTSGTAMRGFETFASHARVDIANNPESFKRQIALNFLDDSENQITEQESRQTELLTWESALEPLKELCKLTLK